MRPLARAAGATVASILFVGGFAAPAFAHVTVNPDSATQGGFAALTFRVPTESDSASTTGVQVVFPAESPLAFVSVKPHPGWSYVVAKAKLASPISSDDGQVTEAVSRITWTADSAASAVKPGQFEEFEVSAGPLPKTASMTFKTLQTYSDGKVVRWIEQRTEGAAEPDHPAPVLTLAGAVAAGGSGTSTKAPSVAAKVAATTSTDAASSSQVRFATALAALALVVGAVGGLLGGMALRRRPTTPLSDAASERAKAAASPR